jgi:putative redox protein
MTIDCRTETAGRLTHLVTIGPHTLRADMPVESGGDAKGPGAHDLFDASLAVCKAHTAMLYARLHGLALDRVEVHVERDAARERQGEYVLQLRIAFEGELSDAQKSKLFEIAGRCPVHKLMTSARIDIRMTLL